MGWKVLIPHAGSRPRTDACRVAIDAAGTMTIRASSELLSKAGLALGDPVEVSLGTDDNAGWVRLMKAVSGGWMLSVNGRPTKNPAGIATLKISFTPAHESRFTDTMPSHPVECVITEGKYLDVCWLGGPAVPAKRQTSAEVLELQADFQAAQAPIEKAGPEHPDIGGDALPIETAEPLPAPSELRERLSSAPRAEYTGANVRPATTPTGDRALDASLGRIRRADPPNPPPPWSPPAEVVPITKPLAQQEDAEPLHIGGAYGLMTAKETEQFVQAAANGADDRKLIVASGHSYPRKRLAAVRIALHGRIEAVKRAKRNRLGDAEIIEPASETTPETWRELRQIALRVKGAGGVMERVNVAEGPDRMKLNGEEMTPEECLRKANVLVDEWEAVA